MFSQSQVMGGFSGGFTTSPATPASESRTRRGADPPLPVTCKRIELLMPNEEKILVGTKEFTTVVIMGRVVEVNKDSLKIDYKIQDEDNGPCVSVRQFAGDTTSEMIEESWVQVFGKLRTFQGEKSITAFRMLPVETEQDFKMHTLLCTYAALFYEKDILGRIHDEMAYGTSRGLGGTTFAPKAPSGGGLPGPAGVSGGAVTNGIGAPQGVKNSAVQDAEVNQGFNVDAYAGGLQGLYAQVHEIIRTAPDPMSGISLQEIQGRLPSVKFHEIKRAVDYLSGEGHCYSTVDDDHFALC